MNGFSLVLLGLLGIASWGHLVSFNKGVDSATS